MLGTVERFMDFTEVARVTLASPLAEMTLSVVFFRTFSSGSHNSPDIDIYSRVTVNHCRILRRTRLSLELFYGTCIHEQIYLNFYKLGFGRL